MPMKKLKKTKKIKIVSYTTHIDTRYRELKNEYKLQLADHKKIAQKLKESAKATKAAIETAYKKWEDIKQKNKGKSGATAKAHIARAYDQVNKFTNKLALIKNEAAQLKMADEKIKHESAHLAAELKQLMEFRKKAKHIRKTMKEERAARDVRKRVDQKEIDQVENDTEWQQDDVENDAQWSGEEE